MDLREYLIIFLISFISNATPFFGTPYTIVTSSIILRHGVRFDAIIGGILVSALGATLAKTVMYGLGLGLRVPLKKNKNVRLLSRIVSGRSFFIALFITSVLPLLPLDDFVFLIGGTSKASLVKMLWITMIGKVIKSGVEIPLEILGIITISRYIRIEAFYVGIITSIIFTILGIIFLKIDLEKIIDKVKRFKITS